MVFLEKIVASLNDGVLCLIEDSLRYRGPLVFRHILCKNLQARKNRNVIFLNLEHDSTVLDEMLGVIAEDENCHSKLTVFDAVSNPLGWNTPSPSDAPSPYTSPVVKDCISLSLASSHPLSVLSRNIQDLAKDLIEESSASPDDVVSSPSSSPSASSASSSSGLTLFIDSLFALLLRYTAVQVHRFLISLMQSGAISSIVTVLHTDCIASSSSTASSASASSSSSSSSSSLSSSSVLALSDHLLLQHAASAVIEIRPPSQAGYDVGMSMMFKRTSGKVARANEDGLALDSGLLRTAPAIAVKIKGGKKESKSKAKTTEQVVAEVKSNRVTPSAPSSISSPSSSDVLGEGLSFNVGLTAKQRADRAAVPLPYAHRGHLDQAQAAFTLNNHNEDDDDEEGSDSDDDDDDDEDPDDDLDV